MSSFSFTVDTVPMAESLSSVNSNVRNVTASVVAMESAVVVAQQKASENICKNVDTGFYLLMKSQFDQKIAAVSSQMTAQMQLMESFKKELDKIMLTMQDDYERIKLRYSKNFNSLDKALETRVHELDKKAYEIARGYKTSQFKNGGEVIKALVYGDETQITNVKEVSATVKSKSLKSIAVMAGNVIEELKYSDSVKNILRDVKTESLEQRYVPVIFTEIDSMLTNGSEVKNIFVSTAAEFCSDSRFLNQLKESSDSFEWKKTDEADIENVKNSFQEKVGAEISDERVAKEMLRLFDASDWKETEAV